MVILFNKSKELIITKPGKIFWRENLSDVITFLLPMTWNDELDLSEFTWTARYSDPGNVAHMEILELVKDVDLETPILYSSNYEDESIPKYLQYKFPIDTKLSSIAGIVNLQLSGSYYDAETEKQYVIHSGSVGITVSSLDDYYALTPDSSLQAIDQKILELNNAISHIDNVQKDMVANVIPDDLCVDSDSILRLSVNGEPKGDGVEILSNIIDVDSDRQDGIIDVNEYIPDDADISPIPQGLAIIDL